MVHWLLQQNYDVKLCFERTRYVQYTVWLLKHLKGEPEVIILASPL